MINRLKTLLVIPPNYSTRFSYPNLGITYLGTILRAAGVAARIFDCQTVPQYKDKLLAEAGNYDIVGFYVNFYSAGFVRSMALAVREGAPAGRIIVGGPYANYQPEKIVEEYADIVVLGEGERPVGQIAAGVALESIPSIVYRTRDGGIMKNEKAAAWADLESLPFPAWDMVDYGKYGYTMLKRRPMVSIMTSRGCPHKCIYCTKLIHGHELRLRSVQNVVDEIEHDHTRYGVREIQFMDDNLIASVPRFKGICEEIIRRGLNKQIVFGVPSGLRPDRGDQEMFDLMKRAGFYFTVIAVETADPDVSESLRRNVALDRVHDNIRMARRAGLIVSTFYIFGTPFDTLASMRRSADFALKSDANIVSIFFIIPFPGTDLYDMVVDSKKIDRDALNRCFSYTSMMPLFEANDWTRDDLVRITKRAYRKFYLSPRRILTNLFALPSAYANPLRLLRLVFGLFFHGNPAHEARK